MPTNEQNEILGYIEFIIPEAYEDTYKKLLHLMVEYGLAAAKDCNAVNRTRNMKIIDCWNIFQSACAAFAIDEESREAEFLYNYVTAEIDNLYKDELPKITTE